MIADDSNRGGRAPRRSRDDVVDAALELLDRVGLPDLSMRRLAEHLGVQPSALYWHVENKQQLLAAVSARILRPVSAADEAGTSLDVAAREVAVRLHDSLLAYRDGAEVVSSSLALGLVEPPAHAHLRAVALERGESASLADTIADTVTHFVVGFTFHQQQRRSADAWGAASGGVAASPERIAAGDDDGFTAALDLIIAGVTTVLAGGATQYPEPRR
ncbi:MULTISPECIES: TetR family transcriptional regulator [Microbacterium]|uniref:TetR family transcriptional regulator n=1 Tax=Microbacterium plantarum TaxID=1816425 RepID=A0ABV5EVQ9_9MICO|nr:TetR family transcriptional regulator [Microbacterium sp. SMR1]RAZ31786.1 TetR/AcrR family transcriptional regulator [Microbacterium sp. SMR1]